MPRTTSWGNVAGWYDELLEKESGTYQKEVILPNLLRLIGFGKGGRTTKTVLDLACGQGFFARAFAASGAKVIASDIAPELIRIAETKPSKNIEYHVSPADKIDFLKENSVDAAVIVLAIQNIENMAGVFNECARVLRPQGALYMVLNHPCFRIPGGSAWGFDESAKVQYRRIDRYISETKTEIKMHPGADPKEKTVSFHRPLQVYSKALEKTGFAVKRMEEWNSHKKSEKGPRAAAEDRARKEIPLFMMIEALKIHE
jgi:ubiquinone/menaquinone biosynthesis C-methylase UbiE